jgi:hypothetical protein
MTKLRVILLSFILIQLLLSVHIALADTGPKPTMEFTFNGEQVTILSGILYECEQPNCSDAAPLKELGPQRFTCDAASCTALAYGFSDYHKLEIQFSDGKTRQSNIFKTAGFDSKYNVTVRAADLLVESRFNVGNVFPRTLAVILICACFLAVGLLVMGSIVFLIRRGRRS